MVPSPACLGFAAFLSFATQLTLAFVLTDSWVTDEVSDRAPPFFAWCLFYI